MIGRFRPARNRRQGDMRMSSADAKSALGRDPVCGMSVDMASARHKAEHAGATYYFCSAAAARSLSPSPRNTSRLRRGRREAETRALEHDLHLPDASRNPPERPRDCPICGMALEPEVAAATEGPSPELADMTRRFWIALALSVPVVCARNGRPFAASAYVARQRGLELDSVGARDAGRAVGGLAVLRARLGVAVNPQPQHVHADRDGRSASPMSTAWLRRSRPAVFRRRSAAPTARWRSISRRRR